MNTRFETIFKDPDVITELTYLQEHYVITPADKASNNYTFTCKKYYFDSLVKELGLNSPPGNPTYTPTNLSASEIIDNHKSSLASFGFDTNNLDLDLPYLYCIPKMHKNPYKQRFIAGSSKCSTKSVSILLTKVLSEIKSGLQKYCSTVYSRSGINQIQASRGRKGKTATKEPSPEPEKKTKTRGRSHQGQGDGNEDTGKGRVTRAVVQEAETPKQGRGRSAGRNAQPPVTPEPTPRSSSRQKTQTPKAKTPSKAQTPKGKATPAKKGRGRGRGKKAQEEVEAEDEEEEEEEEEVEEEEEEEVEKATPKQRGRGRGAGKATPKSVGKAAAKNTPKKSPAKKPAASPSPARKGRRAKAAEEESEESEPQLVLKKVDSPAKKSPKSSPKAGRKASKSPAKSPSKTPTKSPRGRGRKSADKESEETAAAEAEDKEEEAAPAEEEKESKDETDATADVAEGKADNEDAKMKDAEEEPLEAQEEESKKEEEEEAPEEESKEEEEEMEEDVAPAEESKPVEEEIVEEPSAQTNGEEPPDHSPAKKRKLDDDDDVTEDTSVKKARVEEEETSPVENGAETEEAIENDVEAMEQETADTKESEEDKDYVIINKDEVPPPDSQEVLESAPKEVTPAVEEPSEENMEEENEAAAEEEEVQEEGAEETSQTVIEDVTEEQSEVLKEPAVETMVMENEVVATEAEQEEVLESEPVMPESAPVVAESEPVVQEEPTVANSCPEEPVVQQQDLVAAVQSQSEVVDNVAESVTNCVIPNQIDQTQAAIPKPPSTTDWVVNRKFINNPGFNIETSDPSKHFSVASYNILAQCHLDRNDYSFTEDCYLALDYRHEKLMKEMKFLNADIVCMQEVGPSYFESKLLPAMREIGYEGIMMKRTDDYYDEGEASFYKTSRFTPIQTQTYSLKQLAIENELLGQGLDEGLEDSLAKYLDRPDILIITQLRCNNTQNIITIGNIHVHWGKMEVPDVQCVQIASAIKEVVTKAGSDGHPHILCGDFNSEVTSPGYQLCTEGYLSDAMIQYLQNMENLQLSDGNKTSLVNHLWRAFQHTSSGLKSAYAVAEKSEPVVTSYNRVMKAAVDYIFYSANCMDNVGVLQVSPESAICATGGIPDSVFPSDHVSVMAKFSFK
ncbi:hypothetical protein FSP39_013307 [Pinctada imbricata]|uniref:Endonuclease/exonuclease/phosphatase domain-containing protein n=1 Tax=Pinctada imbricata TaxID=66713 RepID=A0AA89C3C8_PINIB|nr:hypothetical protein FSP39_013307 [Pinctada imbricata]